MDEYRDPNIWVRTPGGWGTARELAEKLIDNNIEAAVERLASADMIAAMEKSREETRQRMAHEAEQARARHVAFQQQLEHDRAELERTRKQQERDRKDRGDRPGQIWMIGPAERREPTAEEIAHKAEFEKQWAELAAARKANNERIERERAAARARQAQEREALQKALEQARALTRKHGR